MKALLKSLALRVAPRAVYDYELSRMAPSEREIALLPQLCRANLISVDVGANRGLYCKHLLQYSRSVVVFEPLPTLQMRLRTHFGQRIELHPIALSDSNGDAVIRVPKTHDALSTLAPTNQVGGADFESLPIVTRTLDSFELSGVGFIKIDVEGHEEAVLRGAHETLERNRPNLLIELEERHNPGSIGRVTELLNRLGYAGYFLDEGALKPLSQFDAGIHQQPQNIGAGDGAQRYINNFIFRLESH